MPVTPLNQPPLLPLLCAVLAVAFMGGGAGTGAVPTRLTCASGAGDQLALSRLKKRKLQLKDEIAEINNSLLPDIIA